MMPILYTKEGEEVELVRLTAGRSLVRRLSEMGITPGTHIKIVSNSGIGPIIIEVAGKRFGIGKGVATKLFVNRAG